MAIVISEQEITSQLRLVDGQIKELAEMLPYANEDTRKKFLRRIDRYLDVRIKLMEGVN